MRIFVRAETYPNEYRVPLTPHDARTLIEKGHTVIVQNSETRCFADDEYREDGVKISYQPWYLQPPDTLIIGLKELEHLELLRGHSHLYFSHALKGQTGSTEILEAFRKSKSTLYDLEAFTHEGKRLLSFGFYAGAVAGILGVKAFGATLGPLNPTSLDALAYKYRPIKGTIGIAGSGRTSQGVQSVLKGYGLPYTVLKRGDPIDPTQFDIFFNCVLLDPDYKEKWATDSDRPLLIVDVSCDSSKPNSPLPPIRTTWQNPVYRSGTLSMIAIDNLPSLIPRDASMNFSAILEGLMDTYGSLTWMNARG